LGPPPFYRGRRTAEAFRADGGQQGERAREENARTTKGTKDTKISFSDSRHCLLSLLGLPERRWSFVFFGPFVVRTFLCSRRLADAREEAVDARGEGGAVAAEIAGDAEHSRGESARLAGRLARPGDVGRDVGAADGRLLDVARDLLRRRALLLDGGGDGRRDLADLADRRADLADGGDAIAGGASPGPSVACRKPRRTTRRNSGATSF
jgi:hypothetical protein